MAPGGGAHYIAGTGAIGFDGLIEGIVACSGPSHLINPLGKNTIANTDLAMAA